MFHFYDIKLIILWLIQRSQSAFSFGTNHCANYTFVMLSVLFVFLSDFLLFRTHKLLSSIKYGHRSKLRWFQSQFNFENLFCRKTCHMKRTMLVFWVWIESKQLLTKIQLIPGTHLRLNLGINFTVGASGLLNDLCSGK